MNKHSNYIIEDGVDFYSILNEDDSDSDDEKNNNQNNCCLISHNELDENSITLACNHTFNFIDIYKEVLKQKTFRGSLDKNIINLKKNEFLCPYCRKKQDVLLPHVKNTNMGISFHVGVNSPQSLCMPFHECSHKNKSGKSKGICCGAPAFKHGDMTLCNKHYTSFQKKTQHEEMSNVKLCSALLKSGKRIGHACGAKVGGDGEVFCGRHKSK